VGKFANLLIISWLELSRALQKAFTTGFTGKSRLQDYSFVADAPRHALTVEVFEERDSVLATDAGHVFEAGYVDFRSRRFEGGDFLAKIGERGLMEDEIF
jgi:hypothetical protein